MTPSKFVDAVAAVMGRRMEQDERIVVLGEDVHRLNGGTNGATKGLADAVPRPRARHPDQRERVRRPRRRHGARRPVPSGRGVHVPRLHVGGRRPGLQPDRQGAPHVRRRQPGAARAAHQGRDGLGLRLAAPHGPGRHLRHEPRLAHRRPLDRGRLRRPHERRARAAGSGARDRARRPVRPGRRDPRRRPGLPSPARQGRRCAARARTSRSSATSRWCTTALEAVEQTGIDAELIDLRWLDRASLDWETIGRASRRPTPC